MKKRKFQDGGDVDDKRRGLEVSAGEKVGFLKRLRMGNIDDPKSEAYRQFGAGRGATVVRGNTEDDAASLEKTAGFGKAALDEAARRPTYKASTEGQVDERDRRQEAQASVAKPEAPKKAPIVTKEQMKKAGFDNLRDYLNAQRGLRRRDKPTSKDKKPANNTSYREGSFKKGGSVSASKRADGCAVRGKTKGRMV